MLAFAYTECGLSVEQFLRLSFYEWSLEVDKVCRRNDRDSKYFGDLLATIVNTTPRKDGAKWMKGTDFYPLIFDRVPTKEDRLPMTDKEMKQKFGKQFKKNG